MKRSYLTDYPGFLHGADYNPEQWIQYPDILEQDIEYMKKANCNVVTLGVFSWAMLEPVEGQYDFAFMDKIIERLGSNGIKIILATPSGAKPRWLADKYPETLRTNADFSKNIYGFRHNHCYTSPVYRKKVAEINTRLAERYSGNENIILWHISNEYGGECHCELCQQAFRKWLKVKYDNDLSKLNHSWWSGFWSHTVSDWEEIHSPSSLGDANNVMTGLYMDWRNFVTYQTTDFMRCEIESLRKVSSRIPVTTNLMGTYQNLDYYYMSQFIDVVSWDSYPEWHSRRGNVIEAYSSAFQHDFHRGLKSGKPFLLMESTPSLTNWLPVNKLKRPGMHKLASLQAVAHGSDSVQYFQWRKGRGGMEKFHGAVLDHDMSPDARVFKDVADVGKTLRDVNEICGTKVKSEVAIVYDFPSRWALENASGFIKDDKKYKRTCINHYKEFWKRGVNVDVIGISSDFSDYKLLILPMTHSLSQESINSIEKFVSSGGTVVATYTTGYVNEDDLCYLGGFPAGDLKKVFGITANEIDSLYDGQSNFVRMNDRQYEVVDYCELITPQSARVIACYDSDFYKGTAAVTVNDYNRGKAYYIACRDCGELLDELYSTILDELDISYQVLPEGISTHTRQSDEKIYMFVENYSGKPVNYNAPEAYRELGTGLTSLTLYDYDVKVFEKNISRDVH